MALRVVGASHAREHSALGSQMRSSRSTDSAAEHPEVQVVAQPPPCNPVCLQNAVLKRALDVARGMEYLHAQHVVHGDLK